MLISVYKYFSACTFVFTTYSLCLSISYFNDVIKNVFFSHPSYHDETTYNLNDDVDNYVLMNYMSWPFLSYFIYCFFYLISHMAAKSVICKCLLFTLLNFSMHQKQFLNSCNKTRIEIVTISFIKMQNTVYLVYYDVMPGHAPSQ